MDNITPEQARAMLGEIQQTARHMRNSLATGPLGPSLMLWGLIWSAGFAGTYLLPSRATLIWLVLITLGMLSTAVIAFRHKKAQYVQSDADRQLSWQIGGFWLTIFAYATAFAFMFRPHDGRDFCLMFVLFSMMAYIIMGIWVRSFPLAMTGLGVSIAAILGRYLVGPEPFLLWMAIFGGGGLFAPGLYIQLRWR